jgi:hypothetical protein
MLGTFEIVRPEGVTPDWLTRGLQGRGIDAVVDSFRMDTVGTGQLGETRRFHLTYKGRAPADAPKSLIGKFSSADTVARETGKSVGFYRAEVMFYRELAHRARIRTPAVYVAELDAGNDFALLFEDLAPATVGDQMRGCTVEQAALALEEAALLHATFWNDLELMAQPWLLVPEGAQAFYTTELLEECWDHVKKNYTGRLTPEVTAVCDRFVRNHAYWNRPRSLPKCFSHNDFRPDNMLFGGADGRVAVVDWQTSAFLGIGMDPAYFLGAIFDRETRKANERALLRGYYDSLLRLGVTGYSFDQLLRDYAHYSFAAIVVAIAATKIVKRTDRGDDLFMHMITGGAHQALDNNALDDLPE